MLPNIEVILKAGSGAQLNKKTVNLAVAILKEAAKKSNFFALLYRKISPVLNKEPKITEIQEAIKSVEKGWSKNYQGKKQNGLGQPGSQGGYDEDDDLLPWLLLVDSISPGSNSPGGDTPTNNFTNDHFMQGDDSGDSGRDLHDDSHHDLGGGGDSDADSPISKEQQKECQKTLKDLMEYIDPLRWELQSGAGVIPIQDKGAWRLMNLFYDVLSEHGNKILNSKEGPGLGNIKGLIESLVFFQKILDKDNQSIRNASVAGKEIVAGAREKIKSSLEKLKEAMSKKISLKGLYVPEVLVALYNAAQPKGKYGLYDSSRLMKVEEARSLLEGRMFRLDTIDGRALMVDFTKGDEFDPRLYNKNNGEGLAEKVISKLREEKGLSSSSLTKGGIDLEGIARDINPSPSSSPINLSPVLFNNGLSVEIIQMKEMGPKELNQFVLDHPVNRVG